MIVSYSDESKDTVAVFVDFLWNHFDDPGAVHDINYMARWTIIRVSKQIHKKVPLITQSDSQKTFFIFATRLGKGAAGSEAKSLVRAKVTSKRGWQNHCSVIKWFLKSSRAATKQIEVTHILQEEISSRISEVIDWIQTKTLSLGLIKSNICIVTCNDGYTVQAF